MATKIYEAILSIQAELAREGIEKNRRNQGQGYDFRGIDDVYFALAPLLAKNRLVIIPRVMDKTTEQVPKKDGGVQLHSLITVEYDFVSVDDGSLCTVRSVGEGMDSGDKSMNKAMSAAYKYAAFQTFCIPTKGDNDSENSSPEIGTHTETKQVQPPVNPLQQFKMECYGHGYTPKSLERKMSELSAQGLTLDKVFDKIRSQIAKESEGEV